MTYKTLAVACKPGFWIPITTRKGKQHTLTGGTPTGSLYRGTGADVSMAADCYPCSSAPCDPTSTFFTYSTCLSASCANSTFFDTNSCPPGSSTPDAANGDLVRG